MRKPKTLNLDLDIVEQLDKLPWSTRSQYVNRVLRDSFQITQTEQTEKSKRWARMSKIIEYMKKVQYANTAALISKFSFELNLTPDKIKEYLKTLEANQVITQNNEYTLDFDYNLQCVLEKKLIPGSPEWFRRDE